MNVCGKFINMMGDFTFTDGYNPQKKNAKLRLENKEKMFSGVGCAHLEGKHLIIGKKQETEALHTITHQITGHPSQTVEASWAP